MDGHITTDPPDSDVGHNTSYTHTADVGLRRSFSKGRSLGRQGWERDDRVPTEGQGHGVVQTGRTQPRRHRRRSDVRNLRPMRKDGNRTLPEEVVEPLGSGVWDPTGDGVFGPTLS